MTHPTGLTGAFVLSTSLYGTVDDSYWVVMAQDICAALERAGEHCGTFKPFPPDLHFILDAILNGKKPPHYFITFNLRPSIDVGDGQVWQQSNTPLITVCLDHPVHIADSLFNLLVHARDRGQERLHWIGVMEDGHRPFLHALGWPADRIFRFPQGGPPPRPGAARYQDGKKSGIVFSGTLAHPVAHREFCASMGVGDPRLISLLDQAVDKALEGTEDIFDGSLTLLGPLGLPAPTLIQAITAIDKRARLLRRFRVLSALSDFPVAVYGEVSPATAKLLPHCTFHPGVGWTPMLDVMERARIVVNDTINLRDAGLIRLFYPMSLGTVVASDANRLLETAFTPQQDFIAIGKRWDDTRTMVERVLADDDFAQAMADRAQAVFASGHHWDARIQEMLPVLGALGHG